MKELVEDYVKIKILEFEKLNEFLADKDFESLESYAHKLAGSAGSYGFLELTELGKVLEAAAASDDMGKCESSCKDISAYFGRCTIGYV